MRHFPPRLPLLLVLMAAAIALGARGTAASSCKAKHCAECAPYSDSCTLCHVDFYADMRGVCRKCSSPNCDACAPTGTCAVCEPGHGVKGGRCHHCKLANCAACNGSPNTCQICEFGHGLVKKAGGKPACVKCANKHCLQCDDNPAKCTTCKGRLEAVNGTCVAPTGDGGSLLGGGFGTLTGHYLFGGVLVYSHLHIVVDLPWETTTACTLSANMGGLGLFKGGGKVYLNLARGWDAARFCRTYMSRRRFGFAGGNAIVTGGYAPTTQYGGRGVWDVFAAGLSINLGGYGTASWSGCQCPPE